MLGKIGALRGESSCAAGNFPYGAAGKNCFLSSLHTITGDLGLCGDLIKIVCNL